MLAPASRGRGAGGAGFWVARYRGKHARRGHGGLLAVLAAAVVALIVAGSFLFPGLLRGRAATRPDAVQPSPAAGQIGGPPRTTPSGSAGGRTLRAGQAAWVVAENLLPGTGAWQIPAGTPGDIEGYADQVSAQAGDRVRLFVSTGADRFHVEAYRLGYYGGLGGRFLWRSTDVPATGQPEPTVDPTTHMVEAGWAPSVTVPVGDDWPQGDYLLKLVAATGDQAYVPLTVRDDASHAALVVQNSVATWQAYDRWGGYSLYSGPGGYGDRARVVSFDRPYDTGHGGGESSGATSVPSSRSWRSSASTSRTGPTWTCTSGRGSCSTIAP